MTKKTFVLLILDGWGFRAEQEYNAIAQAHTPYWEAFLAQYPHSLISSSGRCVGLPEGQMGNSEVGHMNIGAGRVIYQSLSLIDHAIESGEFQSNAVLNSLVDKQLQTQNALHIFGLISPGGVHSHEKHIQEMIKLAAQKGLKRIYLHAFLDGRDTPPKSAKNSLASMEALFQNLNCGQVASIIGRYYAMDRDKRWDRIESAYNMLTLGEAEYHAKNSLTALEQAYERGETDEFVKATLIHTVNASPVIIEDDDAVIFMNFRADRARQLTETFIEKDFQGFVRKKQPYLSSFVTLTEYDANFKNTQVAFPNEPIKESLGEVIAKHGLNQLRLAETEKYAHVTFFFNGGLEQAFPHEDRLLIPSPKVATYDLKPEMSAPALTDALVSAIESNKYDLIVCNYANPDMVGHTGNFKATLKAVEVIDACLGRVITTLQAKGGEALITADHGNIECMYNEQEHQAHTAHTTEPVPLVYIGRSATFVASDGKLSDIAPTLLYLMNLPVPKEMTGKRLIKLN